MAEKRASALTLRPPGGTPDVVTVGHAHPDLDALASAHVAASWLGATAAAARSVDPYVERIWRSLGGPEVPVVHEVGRALLVDCQTPDIPCLSVEGAIDHHPPFQPGRSGLYLFGEVGATATLVAESASRLAPKERRLLAAAILSDTKALRSSRTTERDMRALRALHKNWQRLVPLAVPGAQDLRPEELRSVGLTKEGDIRWSSAEGWGPPRDLRRIGAGTTGPFLFTWVDLRNERTVTSLFVDGKEVYRHSERGVLSRRHLRHWVERARSCLPPERVGRRGRRAGGVEQKVGGNS